MTATLTRGSGTFWSRCSTWNIERDSRRPLGEPVGLPVVLGSIACAPTVWYVGPSDPTVEALTLDADPDARVAVRVPAGFRPGGDGTAVVVDLAARTVTSGTSWTPAGTGRWSVRALDAVSLDGDGWGSLAAGLVLERELLSEIPHRLALWTPDPDMLGAEVAVVLTPPGSNVKGPARRAVCRALREYGGVVVGLTDEPHLVVACERPHASNGLDVGPTYRAVGIGSDRTEIPLGDALRFA